MKIDPDTRKAYLRKEPETLRYNKKDEL